VLKEGSASQKTLNHEREHGSYHSSESVLIHVPQDIFFINAGCRDSIVMKYLVENKIRQIQLRKKRAVACLNELS
jgi:hypothetical protein